LEKSVAPQEQQVLLHVSTEVNLVVVGVKLVRTDAMVDGQSSEGVHHRVNLRYRPGSLAEAGLAVVVAVTEHTPA